MAGPALWASKSPEVPITNDKFRHSLVQSTPGSEIERIFTERCDSKSGQVKYLVKWLGHDEAYAWVPKEKFIHPALNRWTREQSRDALNTSTAPGVKGQKEPKKDLDAKNDPELQRQTTQNQPAHSRNRPTFSSALKHQTHVAIHNNSNNQASYNQEHLRSNDSDDAWGIAAAATHPDRPDFQFPRFPHFTTKTAARTDGGSQQTHTSASSAQSGGASIVRPEVISRVPNANTAGLKRKIEYNMDLTPPRKAAKGFITATDAFAQNKYRRASPTARPDSIPTTLTREPTFKVPSKPQSTRRINQAPNPLPRPASNTSVQLQSAQHSRGSKAGRPTDVKNKFTIQPDMPGNHFSGPAFFARVFGKAQASQEARDRQVDTNQQEYTCYFWLCHTLKWRPTGCAYPVDMCHYAHRFTGAVQDRHHQPPMVVKAACIEDLSPKQFTCPHHDAKRGRICQNEMCRFAHK